MLSKRISAVGFGAVAAAALMFSAASADAGTAELKLLQAELAKINKKTSSTTPSELASNTELQAAVQAVIQANASNKKFKAGVFIGEALKTQAAVSSNAGDEIGKGVEAALGTTLASSLIKLVGDAAKTAATGKGAVPFEISSFVAEVIDPAQPNAQTNVLSAARVAVASKTAVAEIIAGYASNPGTSTPTAIAVAALGDKKLAGAVTEIAREVAALPGVDADSFAVSLALVKTPNATKVATGVVASQPDEAGAVTDALLGNTSLNPVVIKGMAGFAKAVGAVADIEQVSVVGALLANQIGLNAAGSKFGVAAGLAKTLAAAILAKPTDGTAATTADNRADEIAEVAAYVVGGIVTNGKVTAKNINATVLNIIKGAIAGSKTKSKTLAPIAAQIAATNLIEDIAGSVANTLNLTPFDTDALKAFLTNPKTLKAIAGKDIALQGRVKTAIEAGLNGDLRFEDGTFNELPLIPKNLGTLLTALVDPETDIRDF